MGSIRKREWVSPKGEAKTAWLVDYRDSAGARRSKQFARKKDAEAWSTQAAWHVSQGTHTADSQSVTVEKAGEHWLARARREGLEPTTIAAYDQHLRLHIVPHLGNRKLSGLTKPAIETFRDTLVETRSRAMASRVLRSLSGIVSEAQRRGLCAQNVASGVTVRRAQREKARAVIPTKAELQAIIAAARASESPQALPLVLVATFAGLRASELRGLAWTSIDLKAATLTVEQRADAKGLIGPPKSAAGYRTIPLAPAVVAELRKWKLRCPKSELGLVFPSDGGKPVAYGVMMKRHVDPMQIAAGVADSALDADGKPIVDEEGAAIMQARYTLHAFRHAAASLWIEQRVSPKRIQGWIGHSSIQVTFDTYGHLFEQAEADAAVMIAVEREVIGAPDATPMQHGA